VVYSLLLLQLTYTFVPYRIGNRYKYRWHTLMLLKYVINENGKTPELNSKKITPFCQKIIEVLSSPREDFLKNYQTCVDVIEAGGWATKDRLKRSLHTEELKQIMISKI
jgi:hypothetical protein